MNNLEKIPIENNTHLEVSNILDNEAEIKENPNWFEYFHEPYPSNISIAIEMFGFNNPDLNKLLNTIVTETLGIRKELSELKKQYPDLLTNDPEKLSEFVRKEVGPNDLQNSQFVSEATKYDSILYKSPILNYLTKDNNIIPENDIVTETVSKFLETIVRGKTLTNDKSYQHFKPKYSQESDNYFLSSIIKRVDEIAEGINNADIIYVAPRSAIYPAQVIKNMLEYLSKKQKINKPFFTFPKNKAFKILDSENFSETDSIHNNFVEYLMESDDTKKMKIMNDLIHHLNGDTLRVKNIIESIEELSIAVNHLVKINNKKEINISIFDEAINQGSTIKSMRKIIDILAEYMLRSSGISIHHTTMEPVGFGTEYTPFPAPLKGSRYGMGQLSRFSKDDEPLHHSLASFYSSVARISGHYLGFLRFANSQLNNLQLSLKN